MPAQKQAEIWNNIEREMGQNPPMGNARRNSNRLGTGAAAVAAVLVLAGGFYAFANPGLFQRATTGVSHQQKIPTLPTFTAPVSIQSVYISAGTPIKGKWTTSYAKVVAQQVLKWLKESTPYTGVVPESSITLDAYPGFARLHLTTADNQEIVVSPANYAVLENGEYKPKYVQDVVEYSVGIQTIYLESPQLYDWLKSGQWKDQFKEQVNPLFDTTLTLPNGQIVTTSHAVDWKDLKVTLQIQGVPPKPDRYASIVGNHSSVLSHTTVSTSAGPATFVLNSRTPPAAAQSSTPTYEYWVIAYRSQYSYAIEAIVTGNVSRAKSEVMQLLQKWKVPK